MEVHTGESNSFVVVRKQARQAVAWMYIVGVPSSFVVVHPVESTCCVVVLPGERNYCVEVHPCECSCCVVVHPGSYSYSVDVHPGESSCTVFVRRQAREGIAWMFIQTYLAVVWLYIHSFLTVLWL